MSLRFDGDDPYSWSFQIDEYFTFHQTPEDRIVAFHLDGRASTWFQWLNSQNMLSTWENFVNRLYAWFGSSRFEDPEGTLAKLTQQGTVEEYQSEFEALMACAHNLSEPLLISFFISSLKSFVRRELQLNRPTTFDEAFALTRMFKGKHLESQTDSRILN